MTGLKRLWIAISLVWALGLISYMVIASISEITQMAELKNEIDELQTGGYAVAEIDTYDRSSSFDGLKIKVPIDANDEQINEIVSGLKREIWGERTVEEIRKIKQIHQGEADLVFDFDEQARIELRLASTKHHYLAYQLEKAKRVFWLDIWWFIALLIVPQLIVWILFKTILWIIDGFKRDIKND